MLKLREASAADAACISRIIAASWRSAYQPLLDESWLRRLPDEAWLPTMRAWLDSGRMYGLMAETDGRAVGCVVFGRSREEDHVDWGEIVSLYVAPDAMGCGIGGALLEAALACLREDGFIRVYLWAIDGSRSTSGFYGRHGFLRTEELVEYRLGERDVRDVQYVREV